MFKNGLDNSIDQNAKLRPVINYNVFDEKCLYRHRQALPCQSIANTCSLGTSQLEGLFCHGFLENYSNFPTVSIGSTF